MIKETLVQFIEYVKANFIVCLVAIYAIAMVIPLIPFSVPIYYLMLFGMFIYMASRQEIIINKIMIAFYFAAALSIVTGNPPVIFRSWERLGLLVLLTGAVSSLFDSSQANYFHIRLFRVTMWLFIIVGIVSFGCYLLGVNYMNIQSENDLGMYLAGAFGGITQHSMILGPLSAFGAIYLISQLLTERFEQPISYLMWGAFFLCVISTLISASRGALICAVMGILIILFFKYKGNMGKFVRRTLLIVIMLIACYPLYSNFASGVIQKQKANEESGSTFSSRDEKWTNRTAEFESSPILGIGFASISLDTTEASAGMTQMQGVVEPGSTWLAILSMTGIVGAIPFYILVFGTLWKLYQTTRESNMMQYALLFALLSSNILHQFAEGYALAGGSYLCYYFWLLLGVCLSSLSYDYGEELITEI